ncbi:TonB-dependent receptor [Antarcticibacterium arcticum]|uniref:TonB-dependent receptor n=1 Tax=Antarcticibacterium arcticum TaxID=2585771 RepID=A0A5B8YR91_9FLAO|nr:TonB-dependent receptor [Antarcticibacterium arcticum]QED38579.1 TonB-dependent receptor [Antarcticibacterium arcticum]
MRFLIIFLLIGLKGFTQTAGIQGKITSGKDPVSFASISIAATQLGTFSNENGSFHLTNIPEGKHLLRISAIGFETVTREITLKDKQLLDLDIKMEEASNILEEVLIVDSQTGLSRRTPYNISSIQISGIENKGNPNGMMGVLREVPGVYGAEFGHGIVKPFIRGLGFSRIVTIYQGNKLENHQWGADHGLGINDLGIRQVDVIKGPASVLYGSGALGGVLVAIDEDKYLHDTGFSGNAGTTFNSISNGIRTYASAAVNTKKNVFFATDLSYENHADYKNGEGRLIGNSRFNTHTLRLHTGLNREKFQNKLSFTYNLQNLGIISDEEMDDDLSLVTTRNDRKMQLPFQQVEDRLISYNQTTTSSKFDTFLHLSHHFNKRKEIETNLNETDLGLKQYHTFYNGRISFENGKFNHSLGIQGSFLKNKNIAQAQKFLIPDADVLENGLYYLSSLDLDKWFLQGAVRYDYRLVSVYARSPELIEYGFILPGDPESRKLTRDFAGFTGSMGVTRKFNEQHTAKFNVSTGFRAPDLAELFSNGPHPGTSRFEKGNDQFGREQSLQADLNYNYRGKRFQGDISAFGSLVNNYIFFTATNQIREEDGLEIWTYSQTNALLYGAEFFLKYNFLKGNRMQTSFSGAIVRAKDQQTQENLTFIPPDNYNIEMGYYALNDKSLYIFSKIRAINDQNRTGFEEDPTPGYTLLNLGVSKEFKWEENSLTAGITVYNSLNKNYVDHLSILRPFNISSPGRNLMLNLKYNF